MTKSAAGQKGHVAKAIRVELGKRSNSNKKPKDIAALLTERLGVKVTPNYVSMIKCKARNGAGATLAVLHGKGDKSPGNLRRLLKVALECSNGEGVVAFFRNTANTIEAAQEIGLMKKI